MQEIYGGKMLGSGKWKRGQEEVVRVLDGNTVGYISEKRGKYKGLNRRNLKLWYSPDSVLA